MKRKIAFFIPSLNFGGIEANTIRLANAFLEDGYDVDLLVGRSEGGYLNRIPSEIKIIDFKRNKLYLTIPQLIRYIRISNPDVIISGGEAPNITLIISKILSIKTKTRTIVSIRTHLSTELKNSKNINKKVMKYLGKFLYRFADKVVTVSKGVAEDASKIFGLKKENIKVIYNPIVDDSIVSNINMPAPHPWLSDKKVPVLLGVGRLVPQKNFTLLIEAFSIVRKTENVKLIIVGEGPERNKLEQKIIDLGLQDYIDLVGYQSNPYIYMKWSDLFVLSSDWEGFGNVIVEAMACGLSVVSTNCNSGPSEILDNGKYGILAEINNSESLADAIMKGLKDTVDPRVNTLRSMDFSVENALRQYKEIIY